MSNSLILVPFFMFLVISCNNETEPKSRENFIETENQAKTALGNKNQVVSNLQDEKLDKCSCFEGIGPSKNDEPVLISRFSNGKSLSLCGYVEKEIQGKDLIMSEFNFFDCDTGASLAEYSALQTCNIIEKKDSIIIEELKYLPVGKDWRWAFTKICRQVLSPDEEGINVSKKLSDLADINISTARQSAFLASLKMSTKEELDQETVLGKLEVLSLIGNDEAWEILREYKNFTSEQMDGVIAEQWEDAIATVEWMMKK